jgi:hypothetical protein
MDVIIKSCLPGTVILFTPVLATFPGFDGFIAYRGKGPDTVHYFAFQAKSGSDSPRGPRDQISWIRKAVLIRGAPLVTSTLGSAEFWKYLTADEVEGLLGQSMKYLMKLYWDEKA